MLPGGPAGWARAPVRAPCAMPWGWPVGGPWECWAVGSTGGPSSPPPLVWVPGWTMAESAETDALTPSLCLVARRRAWCRARALCARVRGPGGPAQVRSARVDARVSGARGAYGGRARVGLGEATPRISTTKLGQIPCSTEKADARSMSPVPRHMCMPFEYITFSVYPPDHTLA